MGIRLKAAVLAAAAAGAVLSAAGAMRSIHRGIAPVPAEIAEKFRFGRDDAMYYVRGHRGYVAVFSERRGGKPEKVTDIELAGLRQADMGLLEKGIPVDSRGELLELLEDLGS